MSMLYTPDYYKPILDKGEDPVTIAIPIHNGLCSLILFILANPELRKKYPLVSACQGMDAEQLFELGTGFTLWELMVFLAEGDEAFRSRSQAESWEVFLEKYAEDYVNIRMHWDPLTYARMTSLNVAIRRLCSRESIQHLYVYDDLVEYDRAIQALIAGTYADLMDDGKLTVLANRLEDVYTTYPEITNVFADDIHQLFNVIDVDHDRWSKTAFAYNKTRIHNHTAESVAAVEVRYWVPEYAEELAKFQENPDFHLYGYKLYPDIGG